MIGINISRIRKSKGLSLTQLAERAGIAKSYLSNIERNVNQNPTINVVERIAAVLEVDINELINLDSKNKVSEQQLDKEWVAFVNELKNSGAEKEKIQEYKRLLEFIKWQSKKGEDDGL